MEEPGWAGMNTDIHMTRIPTRMDIHMTTTSMRMDPMIMGRMVTARMGMGLMTTDRMVTGYTPIPCRVKRYSG